MQPAVGKRSSQRVGKAGSSLFPKAAQPLLAAWWQLSRPQTFVSPSRPLYGVSCANTASAWRPGTPSRARRFQPRPPIDLIGNRC
jgi:hypothetical protein